jgi:excisionase family DNA binding protein
MSKTSKRGGRQITPLSLESATLTPRESQKITRFGVSHTYRLLRSGQMPSIKVGSRFFIPRTALLRWLDNLGARPGDVA